MVQWEQVARREWRASKGLPAIRFSKKISDSVEALGVLFSGKPLYILQADKLTKISYRPPHFVVTQWQRDNPIVSSVSTPDFNEISHLFRDAVFLLSD